MKKILYVMTREIYPITGGREVVLYNYCKGLNEIFGCKIDLFCFRNSKKEINNEIKLDFINNIFYAKYPNFIKKVSNCLKNSLILKKWPIQVSLYYDNKNERTIEELIKKNNYEIVICDMARTAEYLKKLNGIKKVLDMNDLISNRYYRQCKSINENSNILGQFSDKVPKVFSKIIKNKRIAKYILKCEANLLRKYECDLGKHFDDFIFVSYLEANQYNKLMNFNKAITIPIGVDYDYYSKRVVAKADNPTIVFLGNMYISHNRDAVDNFIDNIFNELLKVYPNLMFKIVGKCSESYLLKMKNSNIEVTGIVEDLREHVQSAWISVAPLTYGSGVKTKVLETMAMGLPVVTNEIGAEGIRGNEGNGLFICKNDLEMINIIEELIDDEKKLIDSSERAKKFIENKYKWKNVLKEFDKILK